MSATTQTPPSADPNVWPKIGWTVMTILAVLASANAFAFILGFSLFDMQGSVQHDRMFRIPVVGLAHTGGGAIAMLIGPLQFLGPFRRRFPVVHRWLGRAYLTVVAFSALAGLYLSPGSYAANTFGIAFIALALAWLYTGAQAYRTVRARDFQAHSRWMARNYALTYAAVTLRIEMPLLIIGGMDPTMALNVVGWLCWVPNLILVELWMRRPRGVRTAAPA